MCDGKNGFEKAKNIGLIDCDLSSNVSHYPNLALMKISAYYKKRGCIVDLITYDDIDPNCLFKSEYDVVFASKVFTSTFVPDFIYNSKNIFIGGTGFYYDKAIKLHNDIEFSFPDYSLYSNIKSLLSNEFFNDYSIGFTTRGCIRKCSFCVNRNSKKAETHSKISDFVDNKKPYIMLWDDNICANKDFIDILNNLNATDKPFVFKQGLDIRLLNNEKMQLLWNSNYKKSGVKPNGKGGVKVYHFAFDNINDYKIIERKLKTYYFNKPFSFMVFFYVLVGFDRNSVYDDNFYKQDILDLLKRIKLLFKYNAYPYIMLHEDYKKSPNSEVIRQLARVCNNPMMVTNKTIRKSLELYSKTSNTETTIKYIEKVDPSFLSIVFNSKMPDKALRKKGDF